jgi:integrase
MPRPPLPLGTWGRISRTQVAPGRWRASARYRDLDGVTRQVRMYRESAAKAERALAESLVKRTGAGGPGEITANMRLKELVPLWLDELRRKDRAMNTLASYQDALRLHVIPKLGMLRLREITVRVADRFLAGIHDTSGPGAAKHCRTVLSGLLALAARNDAIASNPVRDTATIATVHKAARSLELAEVHAMRAGLLESQKAVDDDLPALVDFMLGTGMRIGEAVAVTWADLDLVNGTVRLSGTVVRDRSVGLVIQPKPKTDSGWRVLHLPAWLVEQLMARERVENDWGAVFVSQRGCLRDKSNTNRVLRESLDPLGFDWVTSHVFRKTAATLLDEGGLTVRQIADQLGHRRISVTQDTYFGRKQAPREAATILGTIGEVGDSGE